MNGSWGEIADRFLAIEDSVDLIAHQTQGGWLLSPIHSEQGTRTGWGSPRVTEFVALAKLCLLKLGEPANSEDDALQVWMSRIVTDTNGLEPYREPVEMPRVCRGMNHLAAALCRSYEIEEAIGNQQASPRREVSRFPIRAAWLEAKLQKRGNTPHRFAVLNAIDPKTVKKMLAGEPVQDAVIERLAAALDCETRNIPSR